MDTDKGFVLRTDASDYAVGAVLEQIRDDGSHVPVAFWSRILAEGQRGTWTARENHGEEKANRSTKINQTRPGVAHQRGATMHAIGACPGLKKKAHGQVPRSNRHRVPQTQETRTTSTETRQGRKCQGKSSHPRGVAATRTRAQWGERAATPAHRTHRQRAARPGNLPQGQAVRRRGVPNARHPSRRHEAPGPRRPHAAPTARNASLQERVLWGSRPVPTPAAPAPTKNGQRAPAASPKDGRFGKGGCPTTDTPDLGTRRQRQRDARRVIQEGGDGAQAELRASHGSAEQGTGGDRESAQGHAQGAGQGTHGKEQGRKHRRGTEASSSGGGQGAGSGRRDTGQEAGKGPKHGKGAQGRGQGAQVHGAGRGTVGKQAGQGVVDRGRDPRHGQGDRGVGAGRVPKGKCRGTTGPQGQAGRGLGARGGGWVKGRGAGGGSPPQPDVQPVRCIPLGIQQMPAHHTHHHYHHYHHLHNIDPDAGELIPPQPPRPQHQPAPPAPRAEPARMASAGGGRGAAAAPQAQGPQGEPARGAGGARPWDRDWSTVPDPLGDEALLLAGEVYGSFSWANQGTTRGMRNRPFDAVPLRRDGGNCEVPPGGVGSPRGQREGPQVSDLGGVAR